MTDNTRQAYIDGLHQIADFLAEHPEVKLPHLNGFVDGEYGPVLNIYLTTPGQQREPLAEIARAMGNVKKVADDRLGRFEVWRQFAGIKLVASADRAEVCERVVTGTREVTREVPDPEALAAVPVVSVTEVVEDVEWVCTPLLKTPSTSLLRVPEGVDS
jgi:hypothetical protein